MKKSREYTDEAVSLWHEFDWNNISFDQFKQGLSDFFEQAQRDAYNEAIQDVNKVIEDSEYYVSLSIIEEILKLKKQ